MAIPSFTDSSGELHARCCVHSMSRMSNNVSGPTLMSGIRMTGPRRNNKARSRKRARQAGSRNNPCVVEHNSSKQNNE
eukprot:6372003-Amphidinium_carterae.1